VADLQRQSSLSTIEIPGGNAEFALVEQRSRYLMQVNGAPAGDGLKPVLTALGIGQAPGAGLSPGIPGVPVLSTDDLRLLWNGPGMWFAVVSSDAAMHRLGASFDATDATITDLSDARTVLRLSGQEACTVLSKGCPLDIESMPDNSAMSSHISHINALIHKIDSNTYDIYVFRSFGIVLYEWLTDAATEWTSA